MLALQNIDLSSPVTLFILLFFIYLFILWTLLPFAIFGTKERLDKLIKLQIKTNKLLADQQITPEIPSPAKPTQADINTNKQLKQRLDKITNAPNT